MLQLIRGKSEVGEEGKVKKRDGEQGCQGEVGVCEPQSSRCTCVSDVNI